MPNRNNNVNGRVSGLDGFYNHAISQMPIIVTDNSSVFDYNPYSDGVIDIGSGIRVPTEIKYEEESEIKYTIQECQRFNDNVVIIMYNNSRRENPNIFSDDDYACIIDIKDFTSNTHNQYQIFGRDKIIDECVNGAYSESLIDQVDLYSRLTDLMPSSITDRSFREMQERRREREEREIASRSQRNSLEDQEEPVDVENDEDDEENNAECYQCNDYYSSENMTRTDDGLVCDSCYEDSYLGCDGCEEHFHQDDVRRVFITNTDHEYLCNTCRAGTEYAQCSECYTLANVSKGEVYQASYNNKFYCPVHKGDIEEPIKLSAYLEWIAENSSHVPYRAYNITNDQYLGETKGVIVKSLRIYSAEIEANYKDIKSCNKGCYKIPKEIGIAKDGSLGSNGVEFQTPLLQGKKGEECLKATSSTLIENSFTVDKLCGLHVHLDMRDWFNNQDGNFIANLKNLFAFYIAIEDIILSFLPLSRRGNRYCQYLKDTYSINDVRACNSLDEIEKLWYKTRSKNFIDSAKSDKYHSSRYSGINFHSVLANKHLEIRYHSGTINARKILEWVNLHAVIVDSISSIPIRWETIEGIKSEIDLTTKTNMFFKLLKLSSKSEKYFRDRQVKFSDRISDEENIEEN